MAKPQHATAYRAVPPLLRRLREAAGLTQRALGGRLGRPQSWVYGCETANRRVDVAEFVAWCRACGADAAAAFAELLPAAPVTAAAAAARGQAAPAGRRKDAARRVTPPRRNVR